MLAALAQFILLLLQTAPAPPKPAPTPTHADRVVIIKSTHTLTLYAGTTVLKTYRVALGRGDGSAKLQRGDNNTPEGDYFVDGRNAHSSCYRALHLSYPNAQDRARAAKAHVNPGGDVEIHGLPNGSGWMGRLHTATDWTYGCIGVTDDEIDEIWKLVPNGTPVKILHDEPRPPTPPTHA